MKWLFIVFCVYLGSLFFFEQRIPCDWIERFLEGRIGDRFIVHLNKVSFGFRRGLHVRGLSIFDTGSENPAQATVAADAIDFYPFLRRIRIERLKYARLPESYYAPGNTERNKPVECTLPDAGDFRVTLIRPDILAVKPEQVDFKLEISPRRVDFSRIHLVWPDKDVKMEIDGRCYVDFDRQEVFGDIGGLARQGHIRPMLVAIDVPVALPYMDGFTEVPEPCNARCSWKVDLVRSDLDLWLDLHPLLCRYNGVAMAKADGAIHLHNYTRGNCLNYRTTVGPVTATDVKGRTLSGTVIVTGTNNFNTVEVDAKSSQPLADVLKIGGFTGDYVGPEVFGDAECSLRFLFPRAMTNNYEVLNGSGRVTVKNGQLMRMKGFRGLIAAMPSVAPAITWFTDTTQASADYVIENGVVKSDNIYIEGTLFSIKMYGWFDSVKNAQDFTVRVQFAKKDSIVGKVLHPLTWPFTKLLLEFRMTGTPEEPRWQYISVIDRVLEAVK